MPARRPLALFLSAIALLPAACGGDGDTKANRPEANPDPTMGGEAAEDSSGGGSTAEGTIEIVMKGFQFDPKEATVKVGQSVTWRNEDSAEHDAFSEEHGLDTADIGQGKTVNFQPDKAGKIEYICSIHPSMKGTLTVVD
jgi:plastocyanin